MVKIIDGFPTSKMGMTILKRCKWCRNTLNILPYGEKSEQKKVFCCDDCKDEFRDWQDLRTIKLHRERASKSSRKYYYEKKLLKDNLK